MRKSAVIPLVLDTIDTQLSGDLDDVRQNLLDSQQADPEGAFGAFCFRLAEAAGADRQQVQQHLDRVLEAISVDALADKLAEHPEPWAVMAAIGPGHADPPRPVAGAFSCSPHTKEPYQCLSR